MASNAWLYWALASAFFAALTAIFAKLGLQGIDSDFATFIRTLVIIAALAAFLSYTGKWQGMGGFSGRKLRLTRMVPSFTSSLDRKSVV